jgi:hypothetical protein
MKRLSVIVTINVLVSLLKKTALPEFLSGLDALGIGQG